MSTHAKSIGCNMAIPESKCDEALERFADAVKVPYHDIEYCLSDLGFYVEWVEGATGEEYLYLDTFNANLYDEVWKFLSINADLLVGVRWQYGRVTPSEEPPYLMLHDEYDELRRWIVRDGALVKQYGEETKTYTWKDES